MPENLEDAEGVVEKIKAENFDAGIDMLCFNAKQAESSIRAFKNVKHFVMCSTAGTYGKEFNSFPTDERHHLNQRKHPNVASPNQESLRWSL